jgi:HxlR-like helix-turn-helix
VEPAASRREPASLSGSLLADPPAPDRSARIEELFRRFREPVVRLVEQVADELEPPLGPGAEAQRDILLVRSAFGKWSAELLVALHAKPSVGFEELRRTLTGISARVLSIKLNELEQNGMVRREVVNTRPPRVHYSLTERGWTIAWLARPILLYLRVTERPANPPPPAPPSARGPAMDVPGFALRSEREPSFPAFLPPRETPEPVADEPMPRAVPAKDRRRRGASHPRGRPVRSRRR